MHGSWLVICFPGEEPLPCQAGRVMFRSLPDCRAVWCHQTCGLLE